MTAMNTIFLRLEGPLQAWGDTSKFVIRRSMEAPTKSGVLGLICCAMGFSRQEARDRLSELNKLAMGVRIDRAGLRWWDYHTVGAGIGMTTAGGGIKTGAQGTLITRREYLADASFLVALRAEGNSELLARIHSVLVNPKWPVFLGRKSCPPATPILQRPRVEETWTNPMECSDLKEALKIVPFSPRLNTEGPSQTSAELECLIEWQPYRDAIAPEGAEVWYDTPVSFDPPVHLPRLVQRDTISVTVGPALQKRTPPPPRPRADYTNADYKRKRVERLKRDGGLCVFCKLPGTTVQHVTYRRAGGDETLDDLRALCRLCHDAVTMIEYGVGMILDRIDPCDPRWRDDILRTRSEIIRFRSEESRRRALRDAPPRVRTELLEENEP